MLLMLENTQKMDSKHITHKMNNYITSPTKLILIDTSHIDKFCPWMNGICHLFKLITNDKCKIDTCICS